SQALTWGLLLAVSGLAQAQEQLPPTPVGAPRITKPVEQEVPPPPEVPERFTPPPFSLDNSRSAPVTNTIGGEPSASQGRINQLDLANQPFLRPRDVLEYIPGLLVGDHAGIVKANDYMLRGFYLDNGTDISGWIDDVPYNQPNNPHLHGYLDLN